MLCLFPKLGTRIVFIIGFIVSVLRLTCLLVVLCFVALSLFPFWVLLLRTSDGQTFFIRIYRTESRRLPRAQHVEPSVGLAFSSSRLVVFSLPISLISTWIGSHFLVTLLLIHYVARKVCLILHDAASGTIVHGISLFMWHHLSLSSQRVRLMLITSTQGSVSRSCWVVFFDSICLIVTSRPPWESISIAILVTLSLFCGWRVATKFCPAFIYFLLLEPFTLVWFRIHLWPWWIWSCLFLVSSCCPVQMVTSSYTVQGRSVPEGCIYHEWAQLSIVLFRPISLRLSCFSVWCFSHLGCMLSRRRYKDILPNTQIHLV